MQNRTEVNQAPHTCDNKTIVNSPLRTFSIFGNADINVATNSIENFDGEPAKSKGLGADNCLESVWSFVKGIFI
jgi:hypothetical protein